MSDSRWLHSLLCAGLVGLLAAGAAGCDGKSSKANVNIPALHDNAGDTTATENTFRCVHTVTVKNVDKNAKTVAMWLPVPQNLPEQTITGVKVLSADGPTKMEKEPVQGNKFLYCEVPNTGKGTYSMSYEFTITRERQQLDTAPEKIKPVSDSDRQKMALYMGTDRNVVITPEIKKLADDICGNETNPVTEARKVFEWIVNHGEYWKKDKTKYAASGHGSTMYFLEKKTGNCTDFHAMFMSLMRARGVPARIWFGSVFWEDKQGKDEDVSYHCWPEFYAPGAGWVVVDASQADFAPVKHDFYFGNLETRRINFATGRDIDLAPKQKDGKLEYFGTAYAEVDGKAYGDVERKLTYDLVK